MLNTRVMWFFSSFPYLLFAKMYQKVILMQCTIVSQTCALHPKCLVRAQLEAEIIPRLVPGVLYKSLTLSVWSVI